MPEFEKEKELAAAKSLEFIKEGMTIGLGTGSTASYFIRMLGQKVRAGFKVRAIPTSTRTKVLAAHEGIPLTDFDELSCVDVTIDGADEINPTFDLIKGGGGALLREKIVASVTGKLIIIVDSRKPVDLLGRFPLPVEVVPFGWQVASERIKRLGARVELRTQSSDQPFVTTEGNFILDCRFGEIPSPRDLSRELKQMVGVVEHGLFVDMAQIAIVGRGSQVEVISKPGA
ncbi:MAG: ribose-5-phosphate isomerase RpiA [Acidobacteriota bacterium]|nr:MAG: ribose-5-phosphate isomerase RpiA [Acidobacteriota bacterium]